MRRQIHWPFVVLALLSLGYEALAWGGAVTLPGAGIAIRRSIHSEAPFATAYTAIGQTLRAVPAMRDYSNSLAASAFSALGDRIVAQPSLATELIFGPTTTPQHGRIKWLYYAPWVLFAIAAWMFVTRPSKLHLLPRRR